MSAPSPRRYALRGLPGKVYLAFRTMIEDGRELLSLIPDGPEQHILDVTTVFIDNPALIEVDREGEPVRRGSTRKQSIP